MSIPDFEFEAIYRIHSNDGYHYEVRPDPHGLGNIEIAYIEGTEKKSARVISMERKAVPLVIKALDEILRAS